MKKLKAYWAGLSYPVRTLLLLFMLLISVFLTYLVIGLPPLTAKMGLRIAERDNKIGPSQILAEFYLEEWYQKKTEKVIIAQTDYCDILYNHRNHAFQAYPRTNYPVLYSASTRTSSCSNVNGFPLQLILFDRNPQAETAEIEFKVIVPYNETYNVEYLVLESAYREHDGFFYFPLMRSYANGELWLKKMHKFCYSYDQAAKIDVRVKLYDKDGHLLLDGKILPGPTM